MFLRGVYHGPKGTTISLIVVDLQGICLMTLTPPSHRGCWLSWRYLIWSWQLILSPLFRKKQPRKKTHTKRVSFIACSARQMGFELNQIEAETWVFKTITPTNNYYSYYKFSMSNSFCFCGLRIFFMYQTVPPIWSIPIAEMSMSKFTPDLRFRTCPGLHGGRWCFT